MTAIVLQVEVFLYTSFPDRSSSTRNNISPPPPSISSEHRSLKRETTRSQASVLAQGLYGSFSVLAAGAPVFRAYGNGEVFLQNNVYPKLVHSGHLTHAEALATERLNFRLEALSFLIADVGPRAILLVWAWAASQMMFPRPHVGGAPATEDDLAAWIPLSETGRVSMLGAMALIVAVVRQMIFNFTDIEQQLVSIERLSSLSRSGCSAPPSRSLGPPPSDGIMSGPGVGAPAGLGDHTSEETLHDTEVVQGDHDVARAGAAPAIIVENLSVVFYTSAASADHTATKDHRSRVVALNRVQGDHTRAVVSRVVALNRVSFFVLHGERVLLTGPSGSGKSTLLSSLVGQTSSSVMVVGESRAKGPTPGGVTAGVDTTAGYHGHHGEDERGRTGTSAVRIFDLENAGIALRTDHAGDVDIIRSTIVGLVPQEPVVFSCLSRRENVSLGFEPAVHPAGVASFSEPWSPEGTRVPGSAGTAPPKNSEQVPTAPLTFSEKQRVCLERVRDRRILLLDEPVAALSQVELTEWMDGFFSFVDGEDGDGRSTPASTDVGYSTVVGVGENGRTSRRTVVVAAHNISQKIARKYFDRLLVLDGGVLVENIVIGG